MGCQKQRGGEVIGVLSRMDGEGWVVMTLVESRLPHHVIITVLAELCAIHHHQIECSSQ